MCFVWGHRKFYISASNASATVSSRSRAEASAGNFLPQATADAVGCLSVSLGQSRIIRLLVGSVARFCSPNRSGFLMPLKTVKAPSSPAMSRMDQEEAGPAVASAWYSSTAASSGKFIRAPPFTGSTTAISFPYLRATSSHFRHWRLGALPVRTVALKLHQLNYLDGLGGSSPGLRSSSERTTDMLRQLLVSHFTGKPEAASRSAMGYRDAPMLWSR